MFFLFIAQNHGNAAFSTHDNNLGIGRSGQFFLGFYLFVLQLTIRQTFRNNTLIIRNTLGFYALTFSFLFLLTQYKLHFLRILLGIDFGLNRLFHGFR